MFIGTWTCIERSVFIFRGKQSKRRWSFEMSVEIYQLTWRNISEELNTYIRIRVRVAGSSLQPGHQSNLPAPNLQPTANQERNDQYGNQRYIRELLMMGIVMPETC